MNDHSGYSTRISDAYQRIRGIYEHRDDGVLPFLVADLKYSLSGETPELIPDD